MLQTGTRNTDRLAFSDKDLDAAGLMSRQTRWRMRQQGRFPEPVTAGGRKLYKATDVYEWLEDPEAWAEAHRQ